MSETSTLKINQLQLCNKFRISYDLNMNTSDNTNKIRTPLVTILDISYSMQSYFKNVKDCLTSTYLNLGYSPDDVIDIITFSNIVKTLSIKVKEIISIKLDGATYMTNTVDHLKNLLSKKNYKYVKLLIVSDGELHDTNSTIDKINTLSEYFKVNDVHISIYALRVFAQADTRALSVWLSVNTTGSTDSNNMIEYKNVNSYKSIIKSFGDSDQFGLNIEFKGNVGYGPLELSNNNLILQPGENREFWSDKEITSEDFNTSNLEVLLLPQKELSETEIQRIYDRMAKSYMENIKIYKIANTEESLEKINKVIHFFEDLDSYINVKFGNIKLDNSSLKSRKNYILKLANKNKRSIVNKMKQIGNQNNISALSSAQQADWIRTNNISKDNARRMIKEMDGSSFDDLITSEVRNVHAHFKSLEKSLKDANIDTESFLCSFITLENVLDGLRSLYDLVEDGSIDILSHLDILQLVNIVGIAVDGITGEHPDPMTYRINKIYTHCYTSMSDIIMANKINSKLEAPGVPNSNINGCVPVIHPMVFKFMKNNCPRILELSAGYGMRGFIGEIPMTNSYTIAAGLWQMTIAMNETKNKTSLNKKIFNDLKCVYRDAIGSYFNHLKIYLVEQNKSVGYFINNNGITNMLSCMIDFSKDSSRSFKHLDRLYSAIFSFEYYQRTRRIVKQLDKSNEITNLGSVRKNLLYNLLNINISDMTPKLTGLFEKDTEPEWNNLQFKPNVKLFVEKYKNEFWFTEYIPLIFSYLCGNFDDTISETFTKEKLNLDYSVDKYLYFNMVMSLMYYNRSLRMVKDEDETTFDQDKTKMLTPELVGSDGETRGDKMCKEFIIQEVKKVYHKNLNDKKNNERVKLEDNMTAELLKSDTRNFVKLLKEGYTYRSNTVKLEYPSSFYNRFRDTILNGNNECNDRFSKVIVLLKGTYENEVVFNGGKLLGDRKRYYSEPLQLYFSNKNVPEELLDLVSKMYDFKYRSGRSLDELKSAFGYSKNCTNANFTNRHGNGIILKDNKIFVNEVESPYYC